MSESAVGGGAVAPSRAVVLLSGGMDSAVVLAELKHAGHECHALSFDYGQRHLVELQAAAAVAKSLGAATHRIARIDLRAFGGSALTAEIAVPKDRDVAHSHEIPVTYVPARNTIFLSHALALAETLDARIIGIGVNAIDYSGYPDCRPEFIKAFEEMANLSTRAGVQAREHGEAWMKISTPLAGKTKAQIVQRGRELSVNFDLTLSCYDPSAQGTPCGHCDACLLRKQGFKEAKNN